MSSLLIAALAFALGTLFGFFVLIAFMVWANWDDSKPSTDPWEGQYRKRGPNLVIGEVVLRPHQRNPFAGTRVPDRLPEEL